MNYLAWRLLFLALIPRAVVDWIRDRHGRDAG